MPLATGAQSPNSDTAGIAAPALEVRGVSKAFGVVQALSDVSLEVAPGSIHAVVGQNGAGKSTLMQILAGALEADSGELRVHGQPTELRSPDAARRLGIRIVYQELNLAPYQTVAENIFLGIEPRKRIGVLDRPAMKRRARELLERFESDIPVDAKVDELSIGQKQLVEIVKAIAWDAKILIVDEPTAALEFHDVQRLFKLLLRFKSEGGSTLYVSHRLAEVFQICDRITVLRDARVVNTLPVDQTSGTEVIRMMIGRSLEDIFPARANGDADEGRVVLEARGISSGVLDDVSFVARERRVLGIVGLEGAGIRDVGQVLGGDQPVEAGEIRVDGRHLDLRDPGSAVRAGIAYLSADRKRDGLFPILSVGKNLSIGALKSLLRSRLIDRGREHELVQESIEALSIRTPGADQEVRFLSGGNQQKVLLGRSLATQPRIFVLDEPTRGIDVGSQAEIYALMRKLADEGASVIMISNDLTEILGMSDEVLVLHGGRVTARLPGGVLEDEVLGHVVGLGAVESEGGPDGL
jgi:ribose transport system ATP-binding protein